MRTLGVVSAVLCFAACGFCSRVPSEAPKTVVFIYTDPDGAPEHADGTGFLMDVSVTLHPEQKWIYLITAKHVLNTGEDGPVRAKRGGLYARFNLKSGGAEMVPLPLLSSGPGQTVFVDPDPAVDIAIVALQFNDGERFDVLVMGEDLLVTQEDVKKYNIGVGTEIFFTGMFVPFQGQARNNPIVRFGKLAMLPGEKIGVGESSFDAYLVETFAFGGNSGSPVFFYSSADDTPVKIGGVMKGFFVDFEPVLSAGPTADAKSDSISRGNSGIAIVVLAEHIRQILHSEELEQSRRKSLQIQHGDSK